MSPARSHLSRKIDRTRRAEPDMYRSYEYNGFTLDVAVDVDVVRIEPSQKAQAAARYVAVVEIFKEGKAMAVFSPLRFGDIHGYPFTTEIDALMGGFSAGRKIVDDLFSTT
ncbi:hypothetical protein M3I53_20975 [Paraburkholderia sp. CNPSo 3272]|uniref:hypothetical protein n=1 Tax=Paraburkholderia sp. CNPSo 3272 TaxID=2940931 RepID=UPI0020B695DA|nr:hypothetical protein [Paraburkholderia sp. CNPSo 3272]MCP3725568.1 hypothetical protein [Paraburkholderia sp. CNPSo 3272]